ncbi:uncharacterized protein LOC143026928 [Oratosquilla oratoria]|uniref:uncharacterized protein LOC143026928 n=1 Tax=Oratosquilla oratoria TaxID=337810 RepID=UPI003F76A759
MAGYSSTTLFLVLVFAQFFSSSWATCPFNTTEIWADAKASTDPLITNDILVEFETENEFIEFLIQEDGVYVAMATIRQETKGFHKRTLQTSLLPSKSLSSRKRVFFTKKTQLRFQYEDGFFNTTLFSGTNTTKVSLNGTKTKGSGTLTLRVRTDENSRFQVRISCLDPDIHGARITTITLDWLLICIIVVSASFSLLCFGIAVLLLRRACRGCCRKNEFPPDTPNRDTESKNSVVYDNPNYPPILRPVFTREPTVNPSDDMYEEPMEVFSKNPASHTYGNLPPQHCGKSNSQGSVNYNEVVIVRDNEKSELWRPESNNRFSRRYNIYANLFSRNKHSYLFEGQEPRSNV